MEKLIITCSAGYLSYEFPKRKWYQIIRPDRIAMMRLVSASEDVLGVDILLGIHENGEEVFSYELPPFYEGKIFEAMLTKYNKQHEAMEHLIVFDSGEEVFPEVLYEAAKNRNYLTILTDKPQKYANILENIEREYGLAGMLFTEEKDFSRYIKQMSKMMGTFIVAGGTGLEPAVRKKQRNLLYQLPKKSFFLDFSKDEIFCSQILKKRMDFTYVSIPIFLDNTVKNRYNAVVNEGITFQVINKKTFWRRKGNKDGRKEEYSDLRRSEKI